MKHKHIITYWYKNRQLPKSSCFCFLPAGYLSAVGDLNITILPGNTLVTWTAPFTLNVTDHDPDITYQINIIHGDMSTTTIQDHVLTNYTIVPDESIPCSRFVFEVAPKNGAGVGPTTNRMGYVLASDETCSQTVIVKDQASVIAAGMIEIIII